VVVVTGAVVVVVVGEVVDETSADVVLVGEAPVPAHAATRTRQETNTRSGFTDKRYRPESP